MAFAVEGNVAGLQRVLRIRTGAVERAIEVGGDLALDLAVGDVDLGAEQPRPA